MATKPIYITYLTLPQPAAPTGPVVDDTANTFDFTYVEGYTDPEDYEWSSNAAASFTTLTAKPLAVGNVAIASGDLRVRVRAVEGVNQAGLQLHSDAAFTVSGGGGPATISLLSNEDRRTTTSGNWAMTAITPTAGRRLLVMVGIKHEDVGTLEPANAVTLSDSQGLTWTKIGSVADPLANYRHGIAAFISSPAAATSTVITAVFADPNRFNIGVYEINGSDGTTAGFVTNTTAPLSGGYTVTLGATPTADDVVIFARSFNCVELNDGNLVMPAGWTVGTNFLGLNTSPAIALAVAHNDNLSSTSVVVTNTATQTNDTHDGVNMAFIIKAG